MNDLAGLKALVTGSGKRIGAAIALKLAEHGCDVVVHYHSSADDALRTVSEIQSLGRRAIAVQSDLRKLDAVMSLAHECKSFHGSLDILIHAASSYPDPDLIESTHSFLSEDIETFQESLAINASAPFFLTQLLAPLLQQSRNGNMISILDQSVTIPFRSRAAHTVSKKALLGVTQVIADAIGQRVRINALELGRILPGENMHGTEDWDWAGVDSVTETILNILLDIRIRDSLIQVGIPQGKTYPLN